MRTRSIVVGTLILCAQVRLAASGGPAEVEIRLRLLGLDFPPAEAEIVASSPGSISPLTLGVAETRSIALPRPGLWVLQISGSGIWSRPVEVLVPGTAEIVVEPGSSLRGRFDVRPQAQLPTLTTVALRRCGKVESLADLVCAIQPDRTFSCPIPLGCLDGRVRVRGFASHYFWERSAAGAGQPLELGAIPLRPGASVSGWMATEDGRPFDDSTLVRLRTQGMRTDARALTDRLESTTSTARPDRRGFFQFTEVPPGNYELAATQKGYGEAVQSLLYVREGLETAPRAPLVLTRPRRASFQVSPAIAPQGGVWKLRLTHLRASGAEVVAEGPTEQLGYAVFEGLAAGPYEVAVIDQTMENPFALRFIELSGEDDFFPIDLELVELQGRIWLGDEPLPYAELAFGGWTGAESVVLAADEGGEFRGALPREGRWKVEIAASELDVLRSLTNVEVKKRPGGRPAVVEVRLSDGQISGTVVDEDLVPQAKAIVEVLPAGPAESRVATKASPDGTFRIRGLPKGPATVRAETPEAQSEPRAVLLSSDAEDELQLVVRKLRKVRGVVLDRFGAVAAANLYLREHGGVMERGAGAVTELDGSFEVSLPREVTSVHARVGAAGRTLYVGRREVAEEGIRLELAREGGTVDLRYPPERWEWVYFVHDGASAWFGPFQSWAGLHATEGGLRDFSGGRLVVPKLAPGEWDVCLVEPGSAPWLTVSLVGRSVPSACVHFTSSPGTIASADLSTLGAEEAPSK